MPDVGESNWGQNLTNYFVAIPQGCYQLSGGTAPLTADLSFGTNYGLFAKYVTSVTATPATAGVIRLANTDAIEWRNHANGANLPLSVDTSNNLLWNGDIISTASASPVLSIAGTSNEITASAATGNVTLSIPSTFIAPGSIAATTTLAGTTATLSATTNQILLGTTNVITLSSTAPASSQTYTLPDAGASSNVVLDHGSYTIAGTWSFNNAVTIGASTNQIVLGTTRTLTITSPEPASSSRTLTLPDPGGSDSVVYLALAQTLTNKTLTSPVINTGISGSAVFPIANGGTNSSTALNSNCVIVSSGGKIVELATSTSGYLLQCNGSSAPSWVSATPTFAGLTQYGAMYASTTTALASTSAGTANYPLVANSASAPTFQKLSLTAGVTGILPVANGGTNSSTSLTGGFAIISSSTPSIVESSNAVNAAGYIKGTIVQTVQFVDTASSSTTSSTYAATTTTANITPLASTHKIKISISGDFDNNHPSGVNVYATVKRGATDLDSTGSGFVSIGQGTVTTYLVTHAAWTYLDSPATTSATTYKVYIRNSDNSTSSIWNPNTNSAVILLEEIAA